MFFLLAASIDLTPDVITCLVIGNLASTFAGIIWSEFRYRRGRIDKLARELVDQKFDGVKSEIEAHVEGVIKAMDEMKNRLNDGDGQFDASIDRDHRLELTLTKAIGDLRIFMADKLVSKDDLRAHQQSVDKRIDGLAAKIGGHRA